MGDQNNQVGVTFWGVRGSTPCANKENMEYGGNTTCVQIAVPYSDEVLILDSGTGIRNFGNTLSETEEEITGRIFITHPHWDHIQGFPFFKPIYGSKNHFEIHMPRQENRGCKDILAGHLTKTFFPVTLEMIDANLEYITQPQKRMAYKGYDVEFMYANHTIETAIYKIHIGDKKIVFCPDNELNPRESETESEFHVAFMEFVSGADVLIHDGQYDLEGYKEKVGWGHSAWEQVVAVARQADIDHLFITHHDPDSGDDKLRILDLHIQEQFGEYFSSIQLAKEGQQICF